MSFNPDKYIQSKASGSKGFDPDAYLSNSSNKDDSGPSETESGLRGMASGATGGFDDEIIGAIGGAGRLAGIKNLGSWKPLDKNSHLEKTSAPLTKEEILSAYRDNRDAARDEQRLDMETNPVSTVTGNIAGAIVSPLSKIKAKQVMGPLTKGQTFANGLKTAALQGGVYGAGGSDSDLTKGEIGRAATDTAVGAFTGAMVPTVVAGAGKAGSAVGYAGRKAFTSLFGVTEENASKYLANRARINAAPELSSIKDHVDDAVKKLSDDVESGKLTLDNAKMALRDLKSQVQNGLTDSKIDAREAVRTTENLFKEAAAKSIQPLKDRRAPTELAHEVVNAVEDLKRGISEKSGSAWETLQNSNHQMPTSILKSEVSKAIDSLQVGGKAGGSVGQASESAIGSLRKLRSQLDSLPDNLSMPQVKQVIQNLDRDVSYSNGAGQFMDAASREKLGVRKAADKYLKGNVPEYAKAMGPVSEDARLLDEVASGFGDERKAIGRLGQVSGPRGDLDRQALEKLEQATGRNGAFTKPIDEYNRAQTILKDPNALEQMRRALPEYSAYRQAMAKLAKMKPDWSRDQLDRAMSTSREGRALSLAEDSLSKARSRFEPVSSLTPMSTESKLKSFTRPGGAPIETNKAMQALEQQSGKKFIEPLEDRAVLDSFSRPYTNGSKNTLLWTVIGSIFGGLPGAGLGASYGQLVDRYGPKMGKTILDGVSKLKENPNIQTIQSLNLPEGLKKEIEREFRVYTLIKGGRESGQRVADQEENQRQMSRGPAERGESKWASSGLSKLGIQDPELKAQLLQSKEGKRLLIEASDLPAGSARMQRINEKIQKQWGKNAQKSH